MLLTLTVLVLAVGCTSPAVDKLDARPWTAAACTLSHNSESTRAYTCGGPVTVTVDRTGNPPDLDLRENSAREAGLLVTTLDDVGEPSGKLMPATTPQEEAASRNARLIARMSLPAAIISEAANPQ